MLTKRNEEEHISSNHVLEGAKKEYTTSSSKSRVQGHIDNEHETQYESKEEEHNCNECCFQGTSSSELRRHIRIKHMMKCTECDFYCNNKRDFDTHKLNIHAKNCVRCRICGETFEAKSKLMKHRKLEHIETVARCENYINRECRFLSEDCWWIHDSPVEVEKSSGNNF